MNAQSDYFVVVVQIGAGPTVHVVPARLPSKQPGGRLIMRAGPFGVLDRALEAQRRLAQEWCCPPVAPQSDAFRRQYWGE